MELWVESLEGVKDTEMKARIQSVSAQMVHFDFFFGISLGLLILWHTDNLSKTMQKADMSTAEGQVVTTLSTLKSLCNNASFELFWKKITTSAEGVDVNLAALPPCHKTPCQFDDGSMSTFHVTVEDHYRVIYFEVLYLITSCIEDRFNQAGYKTYKKVQALLLKAAAAKLFEEELQFVLSFYGSDFDPLLLPTHLELFFSEFSSWWGSACVWYPQFFFQAAPQPMHLELMSQTSEITTCWELEVIHVEV